MKEFLSLVDDALAYRFSLNNVDNWELVEALPKLDIHIEEDAVDTFTLTQEEDEMKCPVTVTFEALAAKDMLGLPPPVYPARTVIVQFEIVSKTLVNVIVLGNTKPFSAGLAKLGFLLKSKQNEGDAYPEYFRTLANVDMTQTQKMEDMLDAMAGAEVLCGSPCVVRSLSTEVQGHGFPAILEMCKTKKNFVIEV